MSLDPLLSDLFLAHEERHEEAGYTADMEDLARAVGCTVRSGVRSYATPDGSISVQADLGPVQRRTELAHEVSHAVTAEQDAEGNSYLGALRYYHASAPDLGAHLEVLADHGGDRFLMPRQMVEGILEDHGLTARAVWLLHQAAEVPLEMALRRIVTFSEDARLGGFIAVSGVIRHAASYRWHMPCWKGDRMPGPEELMGPGISLFPVPGRRSTAIGLIVIEE